MGTIERYYRATRSMDVDAWLRCFAPGAVSHQPTGVARGHEELRRMYLGFLSAMEWFGLWEDDVQTEDGRVVVRWTGRGAGRNGRPVTFSGSDEFHIAPDGLIVSARSAWDPDALRAELQS
jgi:ketosteroid isomerase-like protein